MYLIGDGSDSRKNATTLWKWRKVNNVNGLVILPDGCTASIDADWATLEAAGAVFLPANKSSSGRYWSSSTLASDLAWYLEFDAGDADVNCNLGRANGLAVRLVRSL